MKQFKFEAVTEYLYSYIAKNQGKKNAKIPSERKISGELNVSRTTVKYAINKLISERLLYKVHGKGTFIIPEQNMSKIKIAKSAPDAFNLNVRSKGLTPLSAVISFKVLYNHNELNRIFPSDITEFYELIRIRSINETPFSIEKCYFPFRTFSDANRYDFSQYSLYKYMEQKGKKPILFKKKIEVVFDNRYNDRLTLPRGTPLFKEEYISSSFDNEIVEYTQTFSDPQNVEYRFNI